MTKLPVLFGLLLSLSVYGKVEVEAKVPCANCVKETCHWQIQADTVPTAQGTQVVMDWSKSIVSRHVEKPYADPLHCNVDRSFNMDRGGYLKVWFEGENDACDAMAVENPLICGVEFMFGPQGPSEIFPSGFKVLAPAGKKIRKVEHKSSLFLYCGNFSSMASMKSYTWDSVLGFDTSVGGDGLYTKNSEPVLLR